MAGAAFLFALEVVGQLFRGEQSGQGPAQQFLLFVAEHMGEDPVHVGDGESGVQDADALVGGLHDAPVAFFAVLQLLGLKAGLSFEAYKGEPQQVGHHRDVEPSLGHADPHQHIWRAGKQKSRCLV